MSGNVFLGLVYFTQHNVLQVPPRGSVWQDFPLSKAE